MAHQLSCEAIFENSNAIMGQERKLNSSSLLIKGG